MNQIAERLRTDLQDEEARYAYADTVTNAFVAAQIRGLREARELSQEELAALVGTKQSGISRLERQDYSTWKVETLRKLARAFGVRLRIRFEPFSTLLDEISDFSDNSLLPNKFEDDSVFSEPQPATAVKDATRFAVLVRGNQTLREAAEGNTPPASIDSCHQYEDAQRLNLVRIPPSIQTGSLDQARGGLR
jgi:transcriptional regulator with XRE-family HTH domain